MSESSSSPNQFIAEIKAAVKADKRLAARVSAATAEGKSAKARGLANLRLSSRSLKLAAADQYNKGLKVEMRLTPEALVALADRVNLFEPSTEVARIALRPKKSGGFRQTYDHAPADRTPIS